MQLPWHEGTSYLPPRQPVLPVVGQIEIDPPVSGPGGSGYPGVVTYDKVSFNNNRLSLNLISDVDPFVIAVLLGLITIAAVAARAGYA